MKKLLTILLAAGMLSIYSCGSGSNTEGTTDSTATTEPAPTEAPAAAPADTMPADTAAH